MKRTLLFLLAGWISASAASAQNAVPLTRDDVSVVKKKLVAMFEALGEAPTGYAMEDESFNLPTEAYPGRTAGRFNPIYVSADRKYGTEKAARKTNAELEKEYKKKMMEAQAQGDYAAMGKLGQEMQQKMSKSSMDAEESRKEPINVQVMCNNFSGGTIDPDAVVMEKAGVIALKREEEKGSGRGSVTVYFDPVTLKDTKQLSAVRLMSPEEGFAKRIGVMTAVVEFHGPLAEIEPWVKRIDTKKVLGVIDGGK
jgi:hypothetical protein